MKRLMVIVLFIMWFGSSALAQRSSAMELGGSFIFKNISSADQKTLNVLSLQGIYAYYFNSDFLLEVDPSVDINFSEELTNVQTLVLIGPAFKLIEMSPEEYRRPQFKRRDLGVVAAVFANASIGFWSEGFNDYQDNPVNAKALAAGVSLGTHSSFGKNTMLRTKAQVVFLSPSPPLYEVSRTLFQVGVGFSVFIKY